MGDPSDSLADRLAIEETAPNSFVSKCLPLRMGNIAPISYGGFPLGVALNAASRTANPNHYLYTATGIYLGPVSTESTITCSVEDIRSTRTFSTRQVRVTQAGRLCFLLTADFRAAEEALLTYNSKPLRQYTSWDQCRTVPENIQASLEDGSITQREAKTYEFFFKEGGRYWDVRPAPEGIFAQNLNGVAKATPTTQDDLPLSEKTTAEWYRFKRDLNGAGENVAALGFLSDAALSFIPLSFSHMFLDDAGPCSSLEFALRMFSDKINLNDWHLVERRTLCGSLGLTHSVANIFDSHGKLAAQMSQQSILRPKPVKSKQSNKL